MQLAQALLVSLVAIACSSKPTPEPVADSAEELGKQLFTSKGCVSCHTVDGSTRIGPPLNAAFGKRVQLEGGLEVLFDDAYFIESVFEPDARIVVGFPSGVEPSFKNQIDDHEMKALIAFVKSSK